ncbi:Galactose/methyl galactoside import ATP-binding protein MglA [Novipirellula artificiosorum]|uniref:Galactose/methyl galactoside import ATP-binding protein MglA n=2 Tax=Novipirellula artificiosorum TaxID=2528016 RepID=A0A5C6DV66_9BACT|nr:Galactose/methyl galactoside import ATP-binding protein MglA [Novipirellula artificiosorum]
MLTVTGMTKRYAVTVLDDVSLDLRSGEIHALIGANGAGKSTLCKIVAGLVAPTHGFMTLEGRPYHPANKQAAESAGVEIVQQELNQIETLTVAENLFLSRLPHRLGVVNQKQLDTRARDALDRFGLHAIPTKTVMGSLGVGRQQMIEIAAALDRECKVLILDEPTAALSSGETDVLFTWLDRLRSQGVGMIYISHRLEEISRLADRVTVLRDGKYVTSEATSQLTTDRMVELMSGDEHAPTPSIRKVPVHVNPNESDTVALRVEGISRGKRVRQISFSVSKGERLGIAGLVGSGRTELLRCLFGADVAESGSITIGNRRNTTPFRHPREAVAAGLAMVTEDRKQNGLLLPLSIRVNTTLASLQKRFSLAGVIRRSAERTETQQLCESLDTRATGIEQSVGTLSGGNQQKVVVAKWLMRDAEIFFFDEPTRGIDVAARERIYRLFDALAAQGKTLLIVSSDLDELVATTDRIAVMSNGRMVQVFERHEWSKDRIMQAAFSGYVEKERS